jgi:FlaG/FlaF family flagellin (archaellin)
MFTSLEVSTMNSDDSKTPNAPPTDTSGKPVNVVERDLEDRDDDTEAVDEVITPSSTRVKEQDAETLQRKIDEIERKVADGN